MNRTKPFVFKVYAYSYSYYFRSFLLQFLNFSLVEFMYQYPKYYDVIKCILEVI